MHLTHSRTSRGSVPSRSAPLAQRRGSRHAGGPRPARGNRKPAGQQYLRLRTSSPGAACYPEREPGKSSSMSAPPLAAGGIAAGARNSGQGHNRPITPHKTQPESRREARGGPLRTVMVMERRSSVTLGAQIDYADVTSRAIGWWVGWIGKNGETRVFVPDMSTLKPEHIKARGY